MSGFEEIFKEFEAMLQPAVNQELIETLTLLLEDAKNGLFTSALLAVCGTNGHRIAVVAQGDVRHLSHAVMLAQHEYMLVIAEHDGENPTDGQ